MATVTELETRTVHHTEPNTTTSYPSLGRQPEEIDFETSTRADAEAIEQQLPPVDSGPAAYRFLLGAFIIEAFQWGEQSHNETVAFGPDRNIQASLSPLVCSKLSIRLILHSLATRISQSLAHLVPACYTWWLRL